MRIRPFFAVCIALVLILVGVTLQLGPVSGAPNDTKLISRANGATGVKGNSASSDAAISANGRFVAFATTSTNLGDTDGFQDVFVRDRVANTTKLVSRGPGATGVNPNGDSRAPSISADGRFVAFFSDATNLPGDTDGSFDIFVRDVVVEHNDTCESCQRCQRCEREQQLVRPFDLSRRATCRLRLGCDQPS